MFRMGSGIWWGAKFSQLICWTCGLSTCATETWYFKSSNFDSDCVIRWLLKWREMLFTTRVVSLLIIVAFFSFLLRIHILFFFLFRISCANLLQTNKNIVHCLNSTQLAGEAPYPDVTYHLTLRRRPLFYGFHFFPHSHSMGSCCPLKKRSVI